MQLPPGFIRVKELGNAPRSIAVSRIEEFSAASPRGFTKAPSGATVIVMTTGRVIEAAESEEEIARMIDEAHMRLIQIGVRIGQEIRENLSADI